MVHMDVHSPHEFGKITSFDLYVLGQVSILRGLDPVFDGQS